MQQRTPEARQLAVALTAASVGLFALALLPFAIYLVTGVTYLDPGTASLFGPLALATAVVAAGYWIGFLRFERRRLVAGPSGGAPGDSPPADELILRCAKGIALVGAVVLAAVLVVAYLDLLVGGPDDYSDSPMYGLLAAFFTGLAILAINWGVYFAMRRTRPGNLWGPWSMLLALVLLLILIGYAVESPDVALLGVAIVCLAVAAIRHARRRQA
jgi:hypothetical protein